MNAALRLPASPCSSLAQPKRSRTVTIIAWLIMVGSVLVMPLSLFALLFIIAGSHGTQNASWGGVVFVGGPFLTLAAGIGLLRRCRWAHVIMVALLVVIASGNLASLVRGSPPTTHTTWSSEGVATTQLTPNETGPWHIAALATAAGLLAILLKPAVRAEFKRVRPAPSAHRRSSEAVAPAAAPSTHSSTGRAAVHHVGNARFDPSSTRRSQALAVVVAIAIMFSLGAGLGWLVQRGLAKGETHFPAKRASHQRIVRQADEPAMFWFSIGLYATLSAGAFGLGAWGVREALRAGSERRQAA